MESLILQIGGRAGRVRELVRSAGESVSIGRGFGNQVVLTDPYVAAEPASFDYEDGRWYFVNLDETNRVLRNGASLPAQRVALQAGDRLTVGRTEIRVFSPDFAVAPTRKLILSDWLHHDSIGWLIPLVALAVFNALDFSVDFLLDTTREIEWKEQVTDLLWVNTILLAWVGIWALNGRLVRHHAHFGQQFFITTMWMIGLVFVMPVLGYLDFLLDGSTLGSVIGTLVLIAMFAGLLRFNLYFSTSGRHATAIGIVASVIVVGGFVAISYLAEDDFELRASAGSELYPGFTLPGSGESVDAYFAAVEEILAKAETD